MAPQSMATWKTARLTPVPEPCLQVFPPFRLRMPCAFPGGIVLLRLGAIGTLILGSRFACRTPSNMRNDSWNYCPIQCESDNDLTFRSAPASRGDLIHRPLLAWLQETGRGAGRTLFRPVSQILRSTKENTLTL